MVEDKKTNDIENKEEENSETIILDSITDNIKNRRKVIIGVAATALVAVAFIFIAVNVSKKNGIESGTESGNLAQESNVSGDNNQILNTANGIININGTTIPEETDGNEKSVDSTNDKEKNSNNIKEEKDENNKKEKNPVLEKYISEFNKWDFEYIKNMIDNKKHVIGSQEDWDTISGSVSYEILGKDFSDFSTTEYSTEYTIKVKLIFNISNPGNSALKKGKNEKYLTFYKYDDGEWNTTFLYNKDEIKESIPTYNRGYSYNGGLGYNDNYVTSEISFGSNKSVIANYGLNYEADLNCDGNKEIVKIDKPIEENDTDIIKNIVINNKNYPINLKDVENVGFGIEYYITDLDTSDNYLEILIIGGYTTSYYPVCYFYRFNGSKVYLYDKLQIKLNLQNENVVIGGDKKIHGTREIEVLTNWFGEYEYCCTDKGFVKSDKWIDLSVNIDTNVDLTVYTKMDTSSEKFVIPAKSKILLVETDNKEWVKIKTSDGKIAYMHLNSNYAIDNDGKEIGPDNLSGGLWFDDTRN